MSELDLDALSGPDTHICWTPDSTPPDRRIVVVLIRESDRKAALAALQRAERAERQLEIAACEREAARIARRKAEFQLKRAERMEAAAQPFARCTAIDLVAPCGHCLGCQLRGALAAGSEEGTHDS